MNNLVFVDELHEQRFRAAVQPHLGDGYREPLIYLATATRTLWLTFGEGQWFQQDAPAPWKPKFKVASGGFVNLSESERVIAAIGWSLFDGNPVSLTDLIFLDDVQWRMAMDALRLSRFGLQVIERQQ